MKTLSQSILFIVFFSLAGTLSGQDIKLITCIDSAMANRGNIKSVRTDIEIAKLQTSSAYQKYLPDLSLSYNYRYNPIIPTQIIPVGQFNPTPTDVPSVKSLRIRSELLEQQQKSERMKHTPTIGFEGFLGASQYTDTFNPFLSGSWYGSSYVGLGLRFQILSGSSTKNRANQLKLEEKGLQSRLADEINSVSNKSLLLSEEIRQIEYQVGLSEQNIRLYEENLSLNQDRFAKGQINAYDLITDEIEFQKELAAFNEKRTELVYKKIELINNSGVLTSFIESLR